MAARPEEGARHTDVHYLEVIKRFHHEKLRIRFDFVLHAWSSRPLVFLSKPLYMPVIPNPADSRAESRVNDNQVTAFPALTGRRLTVQTRETMTCTNEGPNFRCV